MNAGLFSWDQSLYRRHEEDERLSHDRRGIHGFQGIRDNGFTRFVRYRRDLGCPENRSNVDEKCGISQAPSKANPAAKDLD